MSETNMKVKITLVSMDLGVGGAERVMVNIANHWAKQADKEVYLISIGSKKCFYPLEEKVNLIQLHKKNASSSFLEAVSANSERVKVLRKEIKKTQPDVVISFMTTTNVLTIWATRFLGINTIVSDRAIPKLTDSTMWYNLGKIFYRFADSLVIQTEEAREIYTQYGANIKVINNPLILPTDIQRAEKVTNKKTIAVVARMVDFKKHEWSIKAFHKVQDVAQDWQLVLFGDGPRRSAHEELVASLGLTDKVTFYGTAKNVFGHLQNADIFLMTSSREGYPNALAEAMGMGLPCISTKCPYGPSEMIEHGVNGLLAPMEDIDGIAAALRTYMVDEEKRKQHGAKAKQLLQTINIPAIARKWERLFMEETKTLASEKAFSKTF